MHLLVEELGRPMPESPHTVFVAERVVVSADE
jgi:hypothetical protein